MKSMSNSMKYLIAAVAATVISVICCLYAAIADYRWNCGFDNSKKEKKTGVYII